MNILLDEEKLTLQTTMLTTVDELSIEEVVARIQRLGSNPANVRPASGLQGQHLAELMQETAPTFDWKEWQKEWERFEAAMEAAEIAHEQAEWNLL